MRASSSAYWTSELFDSTQSGQRPDVSLEDAMALAITKRQRDDLRH